MYNRESDKMAREKMMDTIIRRFGFENCHTISFAMRCENVPYNSNGAVRIINMYHSLMNLPISLED